jgi:DNA-directed RNA polymerase specialized sigma24 family protein
VHAAFVGLPVEDLQKLKQIARLRSYGLPISTWEDLLQEALFRALSGVRQWPKSVSFLAFLAQTMRSIASDERKQVQDIANESGDGVEDGLAKDINDIAITTITPESQALARSSLSEIETLFKKDSDAMRVLEGLALGMSPNEIQTSSKMTSTQYATTQKRIQRALAQRFGKD